jgi:2-phospho-L-lactate transferase/gluconeogenesis factor (CofD/UPF0052 family)
MRPVAAPDLLRAVKASPPAAPGRMVVSIFCGGRGGSSLIRELLRHPGVELNALINAYDDGLSTGELRGFIPGMLGPSDFRKNLANFLHWHSSHQYALTQLLEFRFSENFGAEKIERLKKWAAQPAASGDGLLPEELRPVAGELDRVGPAVRKYLAIFFEYQARQEQPFHFGDCSLGNLVFAGAYLKNNRNFNAAATELAREFQSQVRLLNVTEGENRVLVALKEDGEILEREAKIVGEQSPSKIVDFFFLDEPLGTANLKKLRALPTTKARREGLLALHKPVTLSPEAREALLNSDLIIYGPGTQFSSLLPSYKTSDIGEAIAGSRARAKIFVANIHRDHDIQSITATDLVATALEFLGDARNERGSITHVLYTSRSEREDLLLPRGGISPEKSFPVLRWIEGEFENPTNPGAHSGYEAVRRIFSIYEEEVTPAQPELDIYINLYKRSLAVNQLLQEFVELPWRTHFKRVRLRFNKVELPPLDLPAHLVVESTWRDEMFSEVHELSEWAAVRNTRCLVTLSGDGEYRLCDILLGMDILTQHSFAAVYGSRNQSRNQFYNSLDAAYGEAPVLYFFSLLGGFLFSFLFFLRFGVIFSDPLTGFRIYNRGSLAGVLEKLSRLSDHSASGITKILMQNQCEIAEIPISYRTFKGFTNTRWRLLRSFRNAWRILF